MPRLRRGDTIEPLNVATLAGNTLRLPSSAWSRVHLQFRRFAGCPICNLHLRTLARRNDEIAAAGVHEVAFFHSTEQSMRPFQGDLPFDVVADPDRVVYRRFGVGSSVRSVLDPRAWPGLVRGMVASHPSGAMTGEGGHLGLPADFLIDAAGLVVACRYGAHANDQWSVDDVLELARTDARGGP